MHRLELLSALVTSRLVNTVQEALSPVLTIHDSYCWLESQCAFYWILGITKELKTFVDNRVKEIRTLVPLNCGIMLVLMTIQEILHRKSVRF